MIEPARGAGDRVSGVGGDQPVQLGDEHRRQRLARIAVACVELKIGRWSHAGLFVASVDWAVM